MEPGRAIGAEEAAQTGRQYETAWPCRERSLVAVWWQSGRDQLVCSLRTRQGWEFGLDLVSNGSMAGFQAGWLEGLAGVSCRREGSSDLCLYEVHSGKRGQMRATFGTMIDIE